MNSCEVLVEVIKANPQIASLRFFLFSTSTKLQDRYSDGNSVSASLIDDAIKLKKELDVRFWHALLALFTRTAHIDEALVCHALYHQANTKYQYIDAATVFDFCMLDNKGPTAVNSKVIMNDGGTRHIPLLDFKVKSQAQNINIVIATIKALKLRGYIIDSGKSFHFIGLDLVSESELIDILAKFSLLAPISDSAWASHQIIERSASLRISPRNGAHPIVVHHAA